MNNTNCEEKIRCGSCIENIAFKLFEKIQSINHYNYGHEGYDKLKSPQSTNFQLKVFHACLETCKGNRIDSNDIPNIEDFIDK